MTHVIVHFLNFRPLPLPIASLNLNGEILLVNYKMSTSTYSAHLSGFKFLQAFQAFTASAACTALLGVVSLSIQSSGGHDGWMGLDPKTAYKKIKDSEI